MEQVLGIRIGVDVLVYLNDVLLFASEAAALGKTIREVLQLLIQAKLKCTATKCLLFTEPVNYLGNIDTVVGIELDLIKIDKIKQWHNALKGSQLASFL